MSDEIEEIIEEKVKKEPIPSTTVVTQKFSDKKLKALEEKVDKQEKTHDTFVTTLREELAKLKLPTMEPKEEELKSEKTKNIFEEIFNPDFGHIFNATEK